MIERIRALVVKYYDMLAYLFFGGLTTLVNYVVFLPLHYRAGLSATVSNALAWVAAVIFAYLTNKPFVFKSHDWSTRTVLPELARFAGCRVGSGLAETVIIFVTVDLLCWNGLVMKIITSVLVVILNYFASKFLVFRKKEQI